MDNHIIKSGQHIRLDDFSPDDHGDWKGKKEKGLAKLVELRQELDRQQGLLYAEHKYKLLIVLQAMDTAGKDGVIRSVLEGVNPQGVRVAAFKVPTPIEAERPKPKESDCNNQQRNMTMKETKTVTKDPIFGMTVDEATALRAERNGETFYFCSDHCRQKFLSTPAGAKLERKSGGCCG